MRLLIAEPRLIDNEIQAKKLSLVRVPLRLGESVFRTGKVSKQKEQMLTKSIQAYKLLMEVYEVREFRAVATSAMREAKNAKAVIARVKEETGVNIELISGKEEAEIVKETFKSTHLESDRIYLYIDVGGGSTELSFIKNGKPIRSRSFKIGTVRLLEDLVPNNLWEELEHWVKTNRPKREKIMALGSGGNINNLVKLLSTSLQPTKLEAQQLNLFYEEMKVLTPKQRTLKYGFRNDRADVIEPATRIYTEVMAWSNISEIVVPKIGVADGIIVNIYNKMDVAEFEV